MLPSIPQSRPLLHFLIFVFICLIFLPPALLFINLANLWPATPYPSHTTAQATVSELVIPGFSMAPTDQFQVTATLRGYPPLRATS